MVEVGPYRWLVERSSTASDLREISRVLLLNLSGECDGVKTAPGEVLLDRSFPLIEGYPLKIVSQRSLSRRCRKNLFVELAIPIEEQRKIVGVAHSSLLLA